MLRWLLLAGAIIAEVAASLSLQAAIEQPVWYILVVTGYLTAFTLLFVLLKRGAAIGVVYGIWGACGVALTAGFAAVIFGQALTPAMTGGIALVVAGVLCVELGSQQARARALRQAAQGGTGASA